MKKDDEAPRKTWRDTRPVWFDGLGVKLMNWCEGEEITPEHSARPHVTLPKMSLKKGSK